MIRSRKKQKFFKSKEWGDFSDWVWLWKVCLRKCYLCCNLTFESKQPKGRVIGWVFQNDKISWAEGMGKVGGRRVARRKALAYFRKRKPLLAKRYEWNIMKSSKFWSWKVGQEPDYIWHHRTQIFSNSI